MEDKTREKKLQTGRWLGKGKSSENGAIQANCMKKLAGRDRGRWMIAGSIWQVQPRRGPAAR